MNILVRLILLTVIYMLGGFAHESGIYESCKFNGRSSPLWTGEIICSPAEGKHNLE